MIREERSKELSVLQPADLEKRRRFSIEEIEALVASAASDSIVIEDDTEILQPGVDFEKWDEIVPGFSVEDLRRAYEIHNQNIEHRRSVNIEIPGIAYISMNHSIVDLRLDRDIESPTVIVWGGGIPSLDSYKVLGLLLASIGYRVIFLPGVLNDDTYIHNASDVDFRDWYYEYDSRNGAFTPDGMIYTKVLEELQQTGEIGNDLRFLGISTGGAISLRTAETIYRQNSQLASILRGIYPINPAGAYPERFGTSKLKRSIGAGKLGIGFVREMASAIRSWEKLVVNFFDAGSGFRYPDLLKVPQRCIYPILRELSDVLPGSVDATIFSIFGGIGDRAIPWKFLDEAVRESASTISVYPMKGNHGDSASFDGVIKLVSILDGLLATDQELGIVGG